jgi:indolepyruvate decarboxylase
LLVIVSAYTVTDYLLDRLAEVGVDRLFGVPGDFTLAMLDHVEAHERIDWVGCGNELGAGYAADGYARMRGIGALCTTFGVGELSAINAIAGAYAEHVPVIHIVGSPTVATQAAARATHHSLGDGDFRHFARMAAEVTCAQASLTIETATDEIDRVIAEALERRLPAYLVIPADVAASTVEPAQDPLHEHPGVTNARTVEDFREAAAAVLDEASSVAVLADILVERMGARQELDDLLSGGLPHATLLWGRRVVDEAAPGYLGTYVGAVSAPPVREAIENSDALIMVGVQFTDLTSGFFSQRLPDDRTIEVGPRSTRVGSRNFGPIAMRDATKLLTRLLVASGRNGHRQVEGESGAGAGRPESSPAITGHPTEAKLDQNGLWDTVSEFLLPGDLVLADQGTAFYGMGAHPLPHDLVFVGQPLWASIGFTLPALLGAALATPERRPIVLIGDGAAQLTVAEVGTLIRNDVPATILVVNNAGYTVERAIHGKTAPYNNIAEWNWTALVSAMDPTGRSSAVTVRTIGELQSALEAVGPSPDRLHLIEAVLPALDVPPLLTALAAAASAANTRHA